MLLDLEKMMGGGVNDDEARGRCLTESKMSYVSRLIRLAWGIPYLRSVLKTRSVLLTQCFAKLEKSMGFPYLVDNGVVTKQREYFKRADGELLKYIEIFIS